jgi:hypothetical protein
MWGCKVKGCLSQGVTRMPSKQGHYLGDGFLQLSPQNMKWESMHSCFVEFFCCVCPCLALDAYLPIVGGTLSSHNDG